MNQPHKEHGEKNLWKHVYKYSFVVFLCLCAVGIGWFGREKYYPAANASDLGVHILRENSPDYHYVNPLLLAGTGESDTPQYQDLSQNIQNYINALPASDNVSDVSVFYQDLASGSWTGVNQDEVYDPASMIKVAVMLAYLRKAQDHPEVMDEQLVYSGNDNDAEEFKPDHPLVQGQSYAVRDLIIAMIEQSDNVALRLLENNIENTYISSVFDALQLPHPIETATTTDYMSPRIFSRLFRVMYNATFIFPNNSEQAMGLLTHTTFSQGLVGELPASTEVAHKFGERTLQDTTGTVIDRELHDCGVIYYPNSPYLLCIMTKGQDYTTLEKVIQDISLMVYNYEPTIVKANSNKSK